MVVFVDVVVVAASVSDHAYVVSTAKSHAPIQPQYMLYCRSLHKEKLVFSWAT